MFTLTGRANSFQLNAAGIYVRAHVAAAAAAAATAVSTALDRVQSERASEGFITYARGDSYCSLGELLEDWLVCSISTVARDRLPGVRCVQLRVI